MDERENLPFRRVQRPPKPRRKSGSGYRRPVLFEDRSAHAEDLRREAETAVDAFDTRRDAASDADFDPKLILQFDLGAAVGEADFERAGLRVLDTGDRSAAVVFSAEGELSEFMRRLSEYAEGRRPPLEAEGDERGARYESFFDSIKRVRPLGPEDRISERLRGDTEDTNGEIPFDVESWYVSRSDRLESWLLEIRQRLEASDGTWHDSFVSQGAGVAVVRASGSKRTVQAVAELDQVALIDSVPRAQLEHHDFAALQDVERLEVVDLAPDAPVVGMIDSGVLSGHPLIAPTLLEAVSLHREFGGQAEDQHGHGTMIAGLVAYGDVAAAAETGVFDTSHGLASVRILDEHGETPDRTSFLRLLQEAVKYLCTAWEAKAINVSVNAYGSPFGGGKSTPIASLLDSLARQFNCVIVISAGNVAEDALGGLDARNKYPEYLVDETGLELAEPAQAAIPLTVGAAAGSAGVSVAAGGSSASVKTLAPQSGPSPITRRGPGVQDAVKPELVEDGGNLVHDMSMGTLARDLASLVVSTSRRYPARLFDAGLGTSFAAARVTNLAGRIAAAYPDLSANGIRSLILIGAVPGLTSDLLSASRTGAKLRDQTLALEGFGSARWDRCGYSTDNRVVLQAEDRLRPDDFHVYRIPVTPGFCETSGQHRISVSLAFDPPVKHRRYDYMAHKMEFLVVRGLDLGSLYDLAASEVEIADDEKLSEYELKAMRPPRTVRSRGANQAASWLSEQRPRAQFHGDWYLVVRSMDRWMPSEAPPQDYAVAVAIEVERAEQLYVELEQEVRAELEVQV